MNEITSPIAWAFLTHPLQFAIAVVTGVYAARAAFGAVGKKSRARDANENDGHIRPNRTHGGTHVIEPRL